MDKAIDPVILAIPFYFILMGLELLVSFAQGRRLYRLADSVSNLSCGIAEQLVNALIAALTAFSLYALCYRHALVRWESSAMVWAIAIFGVDFFYYWWHRFAHEINVIWLTHVVHHQSREYNLSVALRQSATSWLFSRFFYLPLAFLGVPPTVFVGAEGISLLYQFWIHTRLVGRLGRFELVFNTPSHHRVHHGINPEYVDKNYAAILIVWDRLFGTFEEEKIEPQYGTLKPLMSFDPFTALFLPWVDLAKQGFVSTMLKRPGGDAKEVERLYPIAAATCLSDSLTQAKSIYLLLQFTAIIAITSYVLFQASSLDSRVCVATIAWILLGLFSLGQVSDGKRHWLVLELARMVLLIPCVWML